MAKQLRIRIDGELYQYTDAKKDVTVHRSLVDVFTGKKGVASECMNAQCLTAKTKNAERNRQAFPHPVIAVSVIATCAYIIDRPGHAVRYKLSKSATKDVHKFDKHGVGAPTEVTFYAPKGADRGGRAHSPYGSHTAGPGTRAKLVHGEKARLLAVAGALAKED